MRILSAVALTIVFFIFQQSQFLSIYGINPNLLLVIFLLFTFKADLLGQAIQVRLLGVLFAVLAVLVLLFVPFWFLYFAGILVVVLIFNFLKNFMTGVRFFDFLISVILGTFLFYLIINFFGLGLPYVLILWEVVYNFVTGSLLYWVCCTKNHKLI